MYIAVLDTVPAYMVPVLVAHAVLGAHRVFASPKNDNEGFFGYHDWLEQSYKKVVVKVNAKEFEKILQLGNCYLGYESTVLDGEESCAVVCPRDWFELPNVLKYAKLWKP